MIYGIGIDIVDISRIKQAIEKYGERFLGRIFTEYEIKYCEDFKDTKYLHYAARFASKESFSKAIGTGITQGFKFKQVAIDNEKNGKPFIILDGEMKDKWAIYNIQVSLSHTDTTATAIVIIEK
jgi:holo-[acyl-carrier protein] synthase